MGFVLHYIQNIYFTQGPHILSGCFTSNPFIRLTSRHLPGFFHGIPLVDVLRSHGYDDHRFTTMGFENFIVQVNNRCSRQEFSSIIDNVRKAGGEIVAQLPDQSTLIITIESSLKKQIEAMPPIELVGGIQIQPKPLRRIQVRQRSTQ